MSLVRKVALFGAAGAIGQAVAPNWNGAVHRTAWWGVRGRSWRRASAGCRTPRYLPADLADPASAASAAAGIDTIIYGVGLPYPAHRLHPVLMHTTLEAAARAGVERLLLASSVYPYGVPRTPRVAETHPRLPESRKGKYRAEQEDLVLEAHRASAISGLILRLPDFYGPHADIGLANPIFRAALAGKTANWIGPAGTPHEFVYVPDTGPVILDLASCAECYGEAWNFGGAGEITAVDFITRIYRAAGHAPRYRTAGRRLSRACWMVQSPDARAARDALPSGDAHHPRRPQASGEVPGDSQDSVRRGHPKNVRVDAPAGSGPGRQPVP